MHIKTRKELVMNVSNVNGANNQNFGMNVPTILSKKKMQSAIEGITHISRNNLLATKTNWMYSDPAEYPLVLVKYLSVKAKQLFKK